LLSNAISSNQIKFDFCRNYINTGCIAKITDANISITKLDIRKANLEDVFIKLTGKKLSDD